MNNLCVIAEYRGYIYKLYRWCYKDNYHFIKKLNHENIIKAPVKYKLAIELINSYNIDQLINFIKLNKRSYWKIYYYKGDKK